MARNLSAADAISEGLEEFNLERQLSALRSEGERWLSLTSHCTIWDEDFCEDCRLFYLVARIYFDSMNDEERKWIF